MSVKTQPSAAAVAEAARYRKVRKVATTFKALFIATAFAFVAIHPKGDFPGWMSFTVVFLGIIAILAETIRFGMTVENPARES